MEALMPCLSTIKKIYEKAFSQKTNEEPPPRKKIMPRKPQATTPTSATTQNYFIPSTNCTPRGPPLINKTQSHIKGGTMTPLSSGVPESISPIGLHRVPMRNAANEPKNAYFNQTLHSTSKSPCMISKYGGGGAVPGNTKNYATATTGPWNIALPVDNSKSHGSIRSSMQRTSTPTSGLYLIMPSYKPEEVSQAVQRGQKNQRPSLVGIRNSGIYSFIV